MKGSGVRVPASALEKRAPESAGVNAGVNRAARGSRRPPPFHRGSTPMRAAPSPDTRERVEQEGEARRHKLEAEGDGVAGTARPTGRLKIGDQLRDLRRVQQSCKLDGSRRGATFRARLLSSRPSPTSTGKSFKLSPSICWRV